MGTSVEVRRVNLANWTLRNSPTSTTGVKCQFHPGFRPGQRSGNQSPYAHNNNNTATTTTTNNNNKLNPLRYSSEELRPTEAVAARWQYRGPIGYVSAYPSSLISVF